MISRSIWSGRKWKLYSHPSPCSPVYPSPSLPPVPVPALHLSPVLPGFIFLKLVTNPGYRGKIPFSAGAPFTVSYTRLSMTRKNWNSIDWLRTFLLFWIIIFKWIRFNLATCQKYSWGWSNSVSLSSQSPQAHCKVIYNFFNNKLFSSKTEFIFFIKTFDVEAQCV